MEKVGIVIVNYNGANYQNECVKSIINSSFQDFYIIIVDNASKDDSMERLAQFDDDRIVKIYNNSNVGVAAGNNIGIKKSIELGMDATLLLNNDTVLQPNTIQTLVEDLESEDIVSPVIYYHSEKNRIWYGGGGFDRKKGRSFHCYYKQIDNNTNFPNYATYAPTCCLLVNNKVFDKIGLMDESYFMYSDDTDFCMRLIKHDYKIKIESKSQMFHKVSLSTGGENSKFSNYYIARNSMIFLKKYRKDFSNFAEIYNTLYIMAKGFLGLFKRNNDQIMVRALIDYYKGKTGKSY